MAPHVLSARDSSGDSTNSPIIIGGIIVAAVLGLGTAVWIAVRWMRKRAAKKREERRGSAFAHFQGSDQMSEKSSVPRCVPSPVLSLL